MELSDKHISILRYLQQNPEGSPFGMMAWEQQVLEELEAAELIMIPDWAFNWVITDTGLDTLDAIDNLNREG